VFVWHLPVWAAVFIALRAVPFPIPSSPTALWWLTRPVWLALPLVILVRVAGLRLSSRVAQ
jgi:hypothetical protein